METAGILKMNSRAVFVLTQVGLFFLLLIEIQTREIVKNKTLD